MISTREKRGEEAVQNGRGAARGKKNTEGFPLGEKKPLSSIQKVKFAETKAG